MTISQEAIPHLEWILNRNRANKFYEVTVYDTKLVRITQTHVGLMFQKDLPELLNNLGFEIYAIDPSDDKVSLLIKDRRNTK